MRSVWGNDASTLYSNFCVEEETCFYLVQAAAVGPQGSVSGGGRPAVQTKNLLHLKKDGLVIPLHHHVVVAGVLLAWESPG